MKRSPDVPAPPVEFVGIGLVDNGNVPLLAANGHARAGEILAVTGAYGSA